MPIEYVCPKCESSVRVIITPTHNGELGANYLFECKNEQCGWSKHVLCDRERSQQVTKDFDTSVKKSNALEQLIYKLARHIRNTDKVPILEWGRKSIDLLGEVKKLDGEKYERLVKK